jgi:hypothetical protein
MYGIWLNQLRSILSACPVFTIQALNYLPNKEAIKIKMFGELAGMVQSYF